MEYIADTVVVIRHFSKTGRMGNNAGRILRDADSGLHTIGISIISLVVREKQNSACGQL